MDESEETRCQLIKPGSNPPILLQLVDQSTEHMHGHVEFLLNTITVKFILGAKAPGFLPVMVAFSAIKCKGLNHGFPTYDRKKST